MRMVTEPEVQAAYDYAIRGSAKGAAIGLGSAVAVSGLLQHFSSTYRAITVPGRVGLLVAATLAGVFIGGDRALVHYNRHAVPVEAVPPEARPTLLSLIKAYRYQIVGGVWATSMVGALLASFSEPNLKLSQKVIHARIYAQFATISALLGTAVLVQWDQTSRARPSPPSE